MSLQFVHAHDSQKSHTDTIWATRWLPDDSVISVSSDGTAVQWNGSTGDLMKTISPHPLALTSLSVDSTGSRALISSIEGTVMLWDLNEGRVTASKETFAQAKEGIDAAWSVSMNPQGDFYASTGSSGTVKINTANPSNFGETVATLAPRTDGRNKFGMHVAYSPSGKFVSLSTEQGGVFVFDIESKALVHSFSGHATCVRSLAWSADSQLLMSASDDKRLVLYDTRNSSVSATNSSVGVVASLAGHSSWVLSVDISPDGRLAASGSCDQTVKIWDMGSRQCVSTLSDNSGEVWGVSWKPILGLGAGGLVSSGEDGKLRWWRSAGALG